jgi:PucR C-terminal helix-turn-helix domain/GGDEF-like domain
MLTSVTKEPWRDLPASVADVIEPELDAITDEILVTIAREVPEYARPLEGSFGRGVRTGVTEALGQFVDLIRSRSGARGQGREVYVALGRGELRQGRTLDSLQSAYRVGARVAWRRAAAAARRAGVDPDVVNLLAESMFAYIEELSADSVEGYAEARSRLEGERRRRQRELVVLLVREPPADEADVRAAAAGVGWRLPRTATAVACADEELERIARRLPSDALAAQLDGEACAIVPDPDGPGRPAELEGALAGRRAAVGPTVPVEQLAASWALARAALRAAEAGALGGEPASAGGEPASAGGEPASGGGGAVLRADDVLVDLLLFDGRSYVDRIGARRLAPFAELTPKARRRMEDTALAYVREGGNAAAMARALDLHPQTVRYRLARLRELLGEQLDDPDARLELELALRAQSALRDRRDPPPT